MELAGAGLKLGGARWKLLLILYCFSAAAQLLQRIWLEGGFGERVWRDRGWRERAWRDRV
jgi:hypothetical protein